MKLSTSTYLKNIEGISPKVLSQKLKMLERDGFIERKIQDTSLFVSIIPSRHLGKM